MIIRRVVHKGLKRFLEKNDASGLPAAYIERIRNILSFLQDMMDAEELRHVPGWKAHQLSGGRKGMWSLTVSRNWRITFEVDEEEHEIVDLNYEDYH